MNHPAKRTRLLLLAVLLGAALDAFGQLASMQMDELRISVASIYRFGDSRDLDCSIGLKFTGEKADRAVSMSAVKLIQAVDDTGKDLKRTASGSDWPPAKTALWFWQTVRGLKAPAPGAKTIRHFEAEVSFYAPTTNTPVLTDFMSRPGAVLHHPALDRYQVEISYARETDNPPPGSLILGKTTIGNTIRLKVDDPQHKLVSLAFQKAGGGILPATRRSETVNGSHTEFAYEVSEVPPPGLNLVVYVARPEPSDKVHFSFDNIPLPWVDVPVFEASAELTSFYRLKGTNPCACNLSLRFTGGALTNALGIRQLWLHQATDDTGQPVKIRYDKWAEGKWHWRFDALSPVLGDGRYVRKFVPLVFQSRHPKLIRVLEGEAELVFPNATNSGLVTIKNSMNRAGEYFALPPLEKNHVRLAFLGPVNYAAHRAEFAKTNWVAENGGLAPKELPTTNSDSLLFSLEDPDHVVIAPWGAHDINLLDDQGQTLLAASTMTSGKFRVYRFQALPPPGTRLQVWLAVPESLKRIPFKIQNISLQ